jgi:hypothetical protein
MMHSKKPWIVVIFTALLLAGCGGGGSSGSQNTQTNDPQSGQEDTGNSNTKVNGGIINISRITNIEKMSSNTMATYVKLLKVEKIALSEIGGIKENYRLEKGEISADTLNEISNESADLENRNSPVHLENATLYHLKTTFSVNDAYPSGVNFTISLVSTNQNNNFSYTLATKNVIIEEAGEHTAESTILVPENMPEGEYLLVVNLSNMDVETVMSQQKPLSEIPEAGACYVRVDRQEHDRTTALLDINTTKYVDTPYGMKHASLFRGKYLQKESGKGKFLFSNIGDKDVKVRISAKLELDNGELLDVGLLDPSDKKVKREVGITLPHFDTKLAEQRLYDMYHISPVKGYIPQQKRTSQQTLTFMPIELDDTIHGIKMRQAFIPFAGVSVKGERRYRITLGYYLPEETYHQVIKASPDLSLGLNSNEAKGKIRWKVIFIDKQTAAELVEGISMSKFKDLTVDRYGWLEEAYIKPWLIDQLPKPVNAALDSSDGTAYIFSGKQCAKIDPKSGKIIGEWEDTIDVFKNSGFFLFDIKAAFREGNIAYFFSSNHKDYFTYDLKNQKILEVDRVSNLHLYEEFTGNVGGCIDKHLQGEQIEAAFNDYSNDTLYLISGDKYVKLHETEEVVKSMPLQVETTLECDSGLLSDVDAWSSIAGYPITAVLSDHKGNGKLRFYLNGIGTKTVLNKPNLFLDRHNGVEKELGDSDVASLEFVTQYGMEGRWFVPQVRGYAKADLNFYLFGYPFNLFSLDADAYSGVGKIHPYLDVTTVKIKNGAKLFAKILGSTYIDAGAIEDVIVQVKFEQGDQKYVSANMKRLYDGEIASWEDKTILFQARFPVGPILLEVLSGIDGEIQIDSPVDLDQNGMGANVFVRPSVTASVGVFVDGGVNYDVVKAGVEADVTLVETGVNGELSGRLAYEEEALKFSVTTQINAYFNLIRASFSFYAGTRTHIKWCKSWGVPYPCGLDWDVWEIPIYHTPWLYNKEMVLFNETLYSDTIPLD